MYKIFEHALRDGGHITTKEAISTFNLALSLRTAAPRIEAHYQYYSTAVESSVADSNCEVWVLLDNKQYCEPGMESAVKDSLFSS